ncbi:MAG: DUF4431 domain-containing protein [Acetobacteraceae bacterium]|nr:DUF4431 domain-containing protein [Acetobacteraceae bacterium]
MIARAALALALLATPAAAECLRYDAPAELDGRIHRRIVPGPPNYESLTQGDRAETIFVLELAQPICVAADPRDPVGSPAVAQVRRVQLVLPGERRRLREGQRFRAAGRLFHAHAGHHRTDILIEVSR